MQRPRAIALGVYLVGAALVLLPLFDAIVSISPLRWDDVRWRFGAAALLANALLIPNAGLLLLLLASINHGHATFRRVLGVCAFVGVAFWLFAIGMFGLDAVQSRAAVRSDMSTSFAIASWSALGKMLVGTITLFVLGLIGIRGSKGAEGRSQDPAALFVGTGAAPRRG